MGACCGKPDRKGQGYVLGASNTSSNASAPDQQRLGTAAGKAKAVPVPQQQQSAGQTLGGGSPSSPRAQGELSQSALAAQKRAEAVSVNAFVCFSCCFLSTTTTYFRVDLRLKAKAKRHLVVMFTILTMALSYPSRYDILG